uniref:BTB domain-containing protein n=1 Tax=Timema bartmani TaxID=61472 RepID=A0A7R9EYV4_9NEOP|nr:unnamed protein product [Timema bartmani]
MTIIYKVNHVVTLFLSFQFHSNSPILYTSSPYSSILNSTAHYILPTYIPGTYTSFTVVYSIMAEMSLKSSLSQTMMSENKTSDENVSLRSPLAQTVNIEKLSNGFIKDDRFIMEARVAFGQCKPTIDICKTKEDVAQKDLSFMEVDVTSISERADQLLSNGQDGTCEFSVGGETKRASKVLLALKSPVFDRMFFGPLKEEAIIEVTDIESDIFDIMLRHIYEAVWKFESKEQVYEVFYAAQKYMLSILLRSCIEHVWPYKIDDVVFTLNFSKNLNLKYLEEEVMKIVRKDIDEVLKLPDFVDLSQDSLLAIVEQQALNLDSEFELFDAVLHWSRAQCEKQGLEANGHNIRAVLGDVLKHIRFLIMSPEDITGPVCDANIFTTEEQNLILRQYISKETVKSLSNVCCLKNLRERC